MTFVPWPQDRFVRFIESRGYQLRRRLSLGDDHRLCHLELVQSFPDMQIASVAELAHVDPDAVRDGHRLRDRWWAGAVRMPGQDWLILYNPWQSPRRLRASILEEVAHITLEHKPTRVAPDPATGILRREFTKSKEQQAYGVGAAALVPYNGLVTGLARGMDISSMAAQYDVSEDLISFRIKVTGAGSPARKGPLPAPAGLRSGPRARHRNRRK